MRYLLLAFLTFLQPLIAETEDTKERLLQGVFEAPHQLTEMRPEWRSKILSTHQNGSVKELLLIEEGSGIKKRLLYYSTGSLAAEQDASGGEQFIPHGTYIYFYEDGAVKEIGFYKNNVLEGILEKRYPNGNKQSIVEFKSGLPEGPSVLFDQEGNLLEEAFFIKGLRQGIQRGYYPNGELKKLSTFSNGVLNGVVEEYFPAGKLSAKRHYCLGLPHQSSQRYFKDVGIAESGNYILGKKEGEWATFYQEKPSQKQTTVTYKEDKKEGEELFFDLDGQIVGKGTYKDGRPIGDHYHNYNNDLGYIKATYKGNIGKITQYDKSKDILIEYQTKNGLLDGPYEQKQGSKIIKRLNYKEDRLDGDQEIFYTKSGKPFIAATFVDGMRHGPFIEWYESGTPKLQCKFNEDKEEGTLEAYYSSGKKQQSTQYILGKKEGIEELYAENGQLLFRANFVNDVPNGDLVEYYDNGKLKYTCTYHNGKFDGKVEEYYMSGKPSYKASYSSGLLNGEEKRFFEDGSIQTQGTFAEGVPTGVHTAYYPKVSGVQQMRSRITYDVNGVRQGEAIAYFPNSKVQAISNFKDGLLHGKKQLFLSDGTKILDANYIKGNLDGTFIQRKQSSGQELNCTYKQNKLHGLYTEYYPSKDGPPIKSAEGTFSNGKIEGMFTTYNEKGGKYITFQFRDGKRDGLATMYDENGNTLMTAEFKKGKQHGEMTEFFPNSSPFRKREFVHDQQNGPEEIYFDNGVVAKLCSYKNGKLHGLYQEWNPNGILLFEAEYREGLRHGKFNKYDELGSLKIEQLFENDMLIHKKNYN